MIKFLIFSVACIIISFLLARSVKNLFLTLFITWFVIVFGDLIFYYSASPISGNLIAWSVGETLVPIVIGFFVFLLIDRRKTIKQRFSQPTPAQPAKKVENADYEVVDQEKSYQCSSCNGDIDFGDKYCRHCGEVLEYD